MTDCFCSGCCGELSYVALQPSGCKCSESGSIGCLSTLFSPNQISACEPRYLRTSPKKAQIEAFIRSRPLGDFFVLYQLGKNLNRYFFVEFVTRLSDLEEREGAKGDEDEGDTIIDMFIKPAYDESDTLKKD